MKKTQQQLDEASGLHNQSGYGVDGSRNQVGLRPVDVSQEALQLKTGESPEAYKSRVEQLQAGKVPTFISTPGVISSKDDAVGFKADGTRLDEVIEGVNNANGQVLTEAQILAYEKMGYKEGDLIPGKGRINTQGQIEPEAGGATGATGDKSITGDKQPVGADGKPTTAVPTDPSLDSLMAGQAATQALYDKKEQEAKDSYNTSYNTSLSALDETVASTISGINSIFEKRLKEQRRVNDIRIARQKAYGLGSDNALYNPIEFTDIVTEREIEAADAITALEGERNSLIAQAKSARNEGASKLLRDKLADIDKIDTNIRAQLKAVLDKSTEDYKLRREVAKEQEAKQKEAVAKQVSQLTDIAPSYAEDFDKMDDAEQDVFIKDLVKKLGLPHATIYGALRKSIVTLKNENRDAKKDQLGIDKGEIDLAKSKVELEKARKVDETDKDGAANRKMQAYLPDSFTGDKDFNQKRVEFVKKFGKKGGDYWDSVYQKDKEGDFMVEPWDNSFKDAPKSDKKTTTPNVKGGKKDSLGIL
jgi:hypothetical protein